MQQQEFHSECPKEVKEILDPGEQLLAIIRQRRLKTITTPDTIVVTEQRVIRCSPSAFGLKKEVSDYLYQDMANLRVKKGIVSGSIIIKQNRRGDDLVIDNLPKAPLDSMAKVIQEKIRQARSEITSQQVSSSSQVQDPLTMLKTRFVKGEITKEQFEEMKQILE